LGRDSFASGGGGTGNTYNGGKVDVEGVEASVAYNAKDILSIADYNIPLSATYTALDAEFKNSFASSFGEWGNVVAGDNLPYVPKNQIYFSAGIDNEKFSFTSSLKYTDKSRSKAGSGIIAENDFIQSNWTVDLAAEYKINKNLALYTNVMNLFDYEYVAARRPAGLRPGMPFAIMFGVKVAAW
jgi:Fe(3+) dicitrate transport protein